MSVVCTRKPHSLSLIRKSSMAAPVAEVNKLSESQSEEDDQRARAQWLRAAILGANDGLLSTTSLMLGVGAAKEDRQLMIISGVAGALAGACSMAVGEFVSVSTQRDIEQATLDSKNDVKIQDSMPVVLSPFRRVDRLPEILPNPYKAAGASALAFLCGSLFPILSALLFSQHRIRIVAIVLVTSVALLGFGGAGAHLGGSPVRSSAMRLLLGGWLSMAVTYGLLKPLDRDHD